MKIPTCISFEKETVEQIDKHPLAVEGSRSTFVRVAVNEYLSRSGKNGENRKENSKEE